MRLKGFRQMPTPYKKRKPKDGLEWYEKEDLIHGCGLSHQAKHLLLVIKRSINDKKGTCWLSQPQLAEKMGVSVPTVKRAFSVAVKAGVISNKRVRTGRKPSDQHNEYYIVWDKLKELNTDQTTPGGGTPMAVEHICPEGNTDQNEGEHGSNNDEHGSKDGSNTDHHDPVGSVVEVSNRGKQSGEQANGALPAPSTSKDKAKSTATHTPSCPKGTPPVAPPPPYKKETAGSDRIDYASNDWFQALPESEKSKYRDGKFINVEKMKAGYKAYVESTDIMNLTF